MAVNLTIKQLRKTAAQWTSDNTILADGVLGFETDTGKYKIGDGATAWNSLSYPSFATALTWGSITGTLSDQTDLQSALDAKYDASNPSGYITGIAWGAITGTLSSQTDLQTALDAKANLSGAAFTGDVSVTTSGSGDTLQLTNSGSGTTLNILNSGSGDFLTIDSTKLVLSNNGNLAVDTNTLFVDATNNRVGIGTATPTQPLDIAFNNSSASATGLFLENTNSAGRSSAVFRNNNNEGGAFSTYGSTFPASSFRNNFAIAATKSLIFLSDSEVSSGGTSTMSFIAGGYSRPAAMTIFGTRAVSIGTSSQLGGLLNIQAISTSNIPLLIQAAAGQTANLLEVKNSGGTKLFQITASGYTQAPILRATSYGHFGSLLINSNFIYNSSTTLGTIRIFNNSAAYNDSNTATEITSAAWSVQSTTRGFLPPVMTGAQVEAISSPAEGLIAYATNAGAGDVTAKGLYIYNGTNWVSL